MFMNNMTVQKRILTGTYRIKKAIVTKLGGNWSKCTVLGAKEYLASHIISRFYSVVIVPINTRSYLHNIYINSEIINGPLLIFSERAR